MASPVTDHCVQDAEWQLLLLWTLGYAYELLYKPAIANPTARSALLLCTHAAIKQV